MSVKITSFPDHFRMEELVLLLILIVIGASVNQSQIHFPNGIPSIESFRETANVTTLLQLLTFIEKSHFCIGNPDNKFFHVRDIRKGKFMDQSGEIFCISIFALPTMEVLE